MYIDILSRYAYSVYLYIYFVDMPILYTYLYTTLYIGMPICEVTLNSLHQLTSVDC